MVKLTIKKFSLIPMHNIYYNLNCQINCLMNKKNDNEIKIERQFVISLQLVYVAQQNTVAQMSTYATNKTTQNINTYNV